MVCVVVAANKQLFLANQMKNARKHVYHSDLLFHIILINYKVCPSYCLSYTKQAHCMAFDEEVREGEGRKESIASATKQIESVCVHCATIDNAQISEHTWAHKHMIFCECCMCVCAVCWVGLCTAKHSYLKLFLFRIELFDTKNYGHLPNDDDSVRLCLLIRYFALFFPSSSRSLASRLCPQSISVCVCLWLQVKVDWRSVINIL